MAKLPDRGPGGHRPPRRRRQHHEGGHEGLRHRLGGARGPRAVRGVHLRGGQGRLPERRTPDPLTAWTTFTANLQIDNPLVVAGLVIGGVLPFFFTSFLMNAVGVAAQAIVFEVRRQFKEITGIMEGHRRSPSTASASTSSPATALRQLAVPAAIGVITPLAVGFILGPLALAGLLLGVIVSGFPLALTMTTGGGAWDNGKKYIEQGHYGGKHSPTPTWRPSSATLSATRRRIRRVRPSIP